jgi:iron complex outermembrane recepter protein
MSSSLRPDVAAMVRRTLLSAGFVSGVFFPSTALAQVAATAGTTSDEIVKLPEFQVSTSADKGYRAANSVSATRIDTPIKDLPFAVSAFTEQFISDIGERELPEILSYAPGVTSGAKEFAAGNTRFSIRGFDGDVQPQRNGFAGNRYVDTANVYRIETVKGPASLLYGQITPGGTVNYITKRPTDRPFTVIRAEAGNDSFFRTEFDYNQPLRGNVQTRFVGAYENGLRWAETGETKSWLLAPSLIYKITPRVSLIVDYDWSHRDEVPVVGMMPNTQITGFGSAPSAANFPNATARSRAQALLDVGSLNLGFLAAPPIARDFNYEGNGDYRKSDFDSFNTELNGQLGAHWTVRANFNYNKFKIAHKVSGLAQWDVLPTAAYRSTSQSLFDYLSAFVANPGGTLTDASRTSAVTLTRRKRLQQSFAQSNAMQAEAAGKYEFSQVKFRPLVGAFRIYTRGGGFTRTAATAQFFPIWNYFDHSTWDRSGVFDENSLPLDSGYNVTKSTDTAYYGLLNTSLFHDNLIAIVGARYNQTHTDTYNMNAGGTLSNTYETHKTTPQYGLGYHLTKDTLLYASYSESFLVEARTLTRPNPNYNPSANLDAVNNPNSVSVPAQPTTGKGYEAGVKTDFFAGRVSSTVAVFHLERANRVLSVRQNVPGLSTTGTASSQEITFTSQSTVDQSEGVELELTWSPTDQWQTYATWTRMDIKTTSFAPPPLRAQTDPLVAGDYNAYVAGYNEAIALIKGAVPEGSAERLASLWSRYTFKSGSLKGLWIGGGGTYTGRKAMRTANPMAFFSAYTLLDAAAGYDFKLNDVDWTVALNLKNLTDEEYYPANQARGLPRRGVLSVTTRF